MVILHMWLGFLEMVEVEKKTKPQIGYIEQEIVEEVELWAKIVEVYEFNAFNFLSIQN